MFGKQMKRFKGNEYKKLIFYIESFRNNNTIIHIL